MTEKQIQLSAGTINYRDTGKGEPLIFVHGFLVDGELWSKVVPSLEANFRCIVPDWPLGSHKVAMSADADVTPSGVADLVLELIDALGLDQVTLVGNDSGGAIVQLAAARSPERVERIVLTSCDAYDVFPPRMFAYLKMAARIPGAVGVLAQTMRFTPLLRSPIAFGWVSKTKIPTDVLKRWARPVQTNPGVRRDAAKFMRAASPKLTLGAAVALRSFPRPVLLAWAAEDRFFPTRLAERFVNELPDAHLELVAEARTFVAWDQPDRLAELIEKFAG